MSIIIAITIAAAIALIFNRRFEDTVALAIFVIITILYFSGLVTTFIPGAYAVYALFAMGIIVCLVYLIKNRQRVLALVLSPGFTGFIILSIYFFAVSYGRYFGCIDDFIHWGISTKYFYLFSDFCPASGSSDWVPNYPPMSTLWAYFSTKDWITCSTGMMIWGQQMFIMSLLLPVFKLIEEKKNKLSFVTLIICLVTLPYWVSASEAWEYTSLMPDLLMGALFFYIVWTYRDFLISGKRYYLILSFYGAFVITIVKQTGIIHVMLAMFLVFIANAKLKVPIRQSIVILFAYIVSAIAAYASWNYYCYRKGMGLQTFAAGFTIKRFAIVLGIMFLACGFAFMFRKTLGGYYYIIRQHVYIVVFILFVLVSIGGVGVSGFGVSELNYFFNEFTDYFFDISKAYMGYLVKIPVVFLFLLAFFAISRIIKKDILDSTIWNALNMTLVMYAIFRTLGRMVITPTEYPLASLTRYLYSGMLSVILYGFCMAYRYLEIKYKDVVLVLALIVMTNSSMTLTAIFDKSEKPSFPALDGAVFDINDKIFLVDVSEDRLELPFMYEAVPAYNDGDAFEDSWYRETDSGSRRMTIYEVDQKLEEFEIDYVYVRNIDEGFAEYYAGIFDDISDIGSEHIYKVNREGGQLCLELYN